MSWIWMNIPLSVLAVAFTVGLPTWVLLKYPDAEPSSAHTEAQHAHERIASAAREVHPSGTRALHPTAS
jgi:hypothetical protein